VAIYWSCIRFQDGPNDTTQDGNAGGPGPKGVGQGGDPIRYFDGTPVIDTTDLASNGLGAPLGPNAVVLRDADHGANG